MEERNGNDKTPPFYAFRLEDLREWHVVEAVCWGCNRVAAIPHEKLKRGQAPYTPLTSLERKLRCTKCGQRSDHTITVKRKPR